MTDDKMPFSPALTSIVLASVGMLLFFLPILGGPISAVGLLVAIGGMLWARRDKERNLRGSVIGLMMCSFALATNLAVAFAPINLVPSYPVTPNWQPVPDRPYVSPPALPQDGSDGPLQKRQ